MDKKETKLIVAGMLELSELICLLEKLHKYFTAVVIQKGAPNVKNPDNFDYRRN